MNISELKTGMKVVLKDGTTCIVMRGIRREFGSEEDCLVFLDTDGRIGIDNYSEDMIIKKSYVRDYSKFDIEEVYISTNINHTLQKNGWWKLIWKREPVVEEITADEAMKRLEKQSGKRIKIIR